MKRPNITPGEWTVDDCYEAKFLNEEPGRLEEVFEIQGREAGNSPAYATSEADAQAIAALPELLAAMEGVIPFADVDLAPEEQTVEVPIERLKEIKAALTKAGYTFD